MWRVAVFGLGNVGSEYAATRHNAGFMAVQRWAAAHTLGTPETNKQLRAEVWETRAMQCTVQQPGKKEKKRQKKESTNAATTTTTTTTATTTTTTTTTTPTPTPTPAITAVSVGVVAALPLTYMNVSGDCVARVLRHYSVQQCSALVVCDCVRLPLGTLRFARQGGHGGHNGLKSVLAACPDVHRLRIGVGPAPVDAALMQDFVTKHMPRAQLAELLLAADNAAKAIDVWITQGIDAAMNKFN